jgi:hypothetical protein
VTHKRHTKKKTTATASKPKAKPKSEPLDNMEIWLELCETDPDYTKEVGFRGGFTSIDPQYQKQRMTEMFGACGTGWGGEAEWIEVQRNEDTVVVKCTVRVWYRDKTDTIRYLPPVTAKAMAFDNGREDLDSDKKCFTDAFSKSTASLGLNADVFLGKFDDPTYVQELRKKKDGPATDDQVKKVVAIGKLKGEDWVEQITKHFAIETLEDISKTDAELVIQRMKDQNK